MKSKPSRPKGRCLPIRAFFLSRKLPRIFEAVFQFDLASQLVLRQLVFWLLLRTANSRCALVEDCCSSTVSSVDTQFFRGSSLFAVGAFVQCAGRILEPRGHLSDVTERSARPLPSLRFEQARDRGVDVVAVERLPIGELPGSDELLDQARDRVAGEPQLDAVQVLFLAGELLVLAPAIGGAADRDRPFASGFIRRSEHLL
jgi:hypothetical protein